jgi:pimeloyl-ACP methyl ester carboxylesterase
MSSNITRHFATLGSRQVHYRRAGDGPPVILLHQSPMSSRELAPMMRRLSASHTVIAPDMPGYGASDPFLAKSVSMDMLAGNLAELMDELGIPVAAFYGFHTGASLATAFARRYPQRVVVAIAEGLLCLDESTRQELLANYLHPFVPQWDGAHLAWLWSRIKDQSVFFPWYTRTEHSRLSMDGAAPAVLAVNALDWLRSGNHYMRCYAAALGYQPALDLPHIGTPHYIVGRQGDPIAQQMQQWPTLGANFHLQLYGSGSELEAAVEAIFQQYSARAHAPAVVPSRPLPSGMWQDYVDSHGQQLRIARAGGSDQPLAIVQHGAQGSLQSCAELITGLAQRRSVLAIELPGHGETESLADADLCIDNLTQLLRGALQTLGVTGGDLLGMGVGAALQVELLRVQALKANSLSLINVIDVTADPALQSQLFDSYRPIEHDSWGGFLLRAWHQARDHLLFFPWYERRRAYAAAGMPMLDNAVLQRRMVDLLLSGGSGNALCQAELHYPLSERLTALSLAPTFAAPVWESRYVHTQRLAAASGQFVALPREWHGAGAALLQAGAD